MPESTGPKEPPNLIAAVLRQLGDQGIDVEPLRKQLRDQGIDVEALGSSPCCDQGTPVKVVAVTANVGEALGLMGRSRRDQVIMVRVDEETAKELDAWVETGVVKSRSEGAALFIREGLQVRAGELSALGEALRDLEAARAKLRKKVEEVLGGAPEITGP